MRKEKRAVHIILSSREVVARDLPHPTILSLLNRKQQPYFMREAEDPGTLRAARCTPPTSGMTPNLQGVGPVFARPARTGAPLRSGFTLIELLVVVLIIGILAAVALPKYEQAVWKSRLATIKSVAKAMADAEETYYLANGEYTDDMDALSAELPHYSSTETEGESTPKYIYPWGWCIMRPTQWSMNVQCQLNKNNAAFISYQANLAHRWTYPGRKVCYAYNSFAETICKSDTGASTHTFDNPKGYLYN